MGYLKDAKSYSEETHQLPYPLYAKGETNYSLILQQIKDFMGNKSEFDPLFTKKEDIPMIESFFDQFCASSPGDYPHHYRVYPLHRLFFEIKNAAVQNSIDNKGFTSIDIAEHHLNTDQNEYLKDIACNVSSFFKFLHFVFEVVPII